jgi:hypothetical protein
MEGAGHGIAREFKETIDEAIKAGILPAKIHLRLLEKFPAREALVPTAKQITTVSRCMDMHTIIFLFALFMFCTKNITVQSLA